MDSAAHLELFVDAQRPVYGQVLRELTAGRKESHWIWFIFPQMAGLGSSAMSSKFGINSAEEARRYLDHPVLGQRLRECTRLMLSHAELEVESIMAYPDDLKFRSSMTLFATVAPEEPLFGEALGRFFAGERDSHTIRLLDNSQHS